MKKVKNEEDIYVGDAIQIFDPDGNGNGKEQKAVVNLPEWMICLKEHLSMLLSDLKM